jgi:hypothetical protein
MAATLIATAGLAVFGQPAAWVALQWTVAQGAFATICLFLGLIGEQVRLISEMVRNTPLVIEKERVNFPDR